jgi:hypothetical protein
MSALGGSFVKESQNIATFDAETYSLKGEIDIDRQEEILSGFLIRSILRC